MNADGKYHIRSVLLGFSKLLGELVEKYVSTCTKGYTLKKKKRSDRDLSNDANAMFCVFFFVLIFFVKAYVVCTHLNCINKLMQFKWVPTTCALIKK